MENTCHFPPMAVNKLLLFSREKERWACSSFLIKIWFLGYIFFALTCVGKILSLPGGAYLRTPLS